MIKKYEMELGGRPLVIETGRVAHQASGAVTVKYGETMILAVVTAAKEAREGMDFLPLTVDVVEKAYAAGKLPGGFFKREGRPSTEGILACRLVDRPLRPLFPERFYNETQVIITVLSSDGENPHPALNIIGASAALAISDIPFGGPIGACVIGLINGELIVNPSYDELKTSHLELTVAGNGEATTMVEAGARFVSEDILLEALTLAQEVNGEIANQIREIQDEIGKEKWTIPNPSDEQISAEKATRQLVGHRMKDILYDPVDKKSRNDRIKQVMQDVNSELAEEHDSHHVQETLYLVEKETVRKAILEDGHRPDGRTLTEIRDLSSEVGYVPKVHGSGLFTRGETQILGVLTLASAGEAQKLDGYSPETSKYFIHHYNFPPYSAGETGRFGFTGRREIGHGALAERALLPVIPSQEEFPYTIRLVSETMSSNGSTSMASVCAGTLALMDGGIPIKSPVAGIAMGLITGAKGNYAILTDIQGAEDHSGDMDFKVAGTKEGVTALQMDIKVTGITFEIMKEALEQARVARLQIIEHITTTIDEPRSELNENAPRMISLQVPVDKIGAVIGSGGSVIRGMIEEYGVTIDVADDGTVVIGGTDGDSTSRAQQAINDLTRDAEVGELYSGKVVRIMPYGAFVEILPGKDGLVHISELSTERIPEVESVVNMGDEIKVMVISVDAGGKVDLSHRATLENEDLDTVIERRKLDRKSFGGDRRGGDRRDRGGSNSRGFGGRNDQRNRRDDNGYNSSRSRRTVGGYDGARKRSSPPRDF
jgi:polyribonucleotide nucleotidyltransferase